MSTILLLACIGMITGFFFLLGVSPMEFSDDIFKRVLNKPKSIRDEINESTKRKKPSFLRREITEIQEILRVTGRSNRFGGICASALLLFAVGASAAIMMGNPFLVPVLAVGFMFLPFWYVRLTQSHFKRDIAAELETALSIITTAYLRNDDILTAVEENLHYLNPPVLGIFQEFSTKVRLVNPNIDSALSDIKGRIDNEVYREWVDAVAACQSDRSLKTTLTPIVNKLSDMRIVNGELENLVSEPRKEFIIMAAMVIGNVPLMFFLNHSWFETLMYTPVGQFIIAACATAIFVSTAFVIKLTQPIEYRR